MCFLIELYNINYEIFLIKVEFEFDYIFKFFGLQEISGIKGYVEYY